MNFRVDVELNVAVGDSFGARCDEVGVGYVGGVGAVVLGDDSAIVESHLG